jgi:hypothetical protein
MRIRGVTPVTSNAPNIEIGFGLRRSVPAPSAGEPACTFKFGKVVGGVTLMLTNFGSANCEFASWPVPDL